MITSFYLFTAGEFGQTRDGTDEYDEAPPSRPVSRHPTPTAATHVGAPEGPSPAAAPHALANVCAPRLPTASPLGPSTPRPQRGLWPAAPSEARPAAGFDTRPRMLQTASLVTPTRFTH